MDRSTETFSEAQIAALHQVFAQGFTEVVLPHLDEIKQDIEQLKANDAENKDDIGDIKSRLTSIEKKLDSTITRTDDHEHQIAELKNALA